MNYTLKSLLAAVLLSGFAMPFTAVAQTENPRGIYKMVTLIGKNGAEDAPFDQYKICTDSLTAMLVTMDNGAFSISDTDRKVFNYTGGKHEDENDHTTLIYDSDANGFTLKWWSTSFPAHKYFPENGWCTEIYKSGVYSEVGKTIFDALTATELSDKANPFVGRWELIGYMDELDNVKNELKALIQNYPYSKYYHNAYWLITNDMSVTGGNRGGRLTKIEYKNKNLILFNGKRTNVKWLTKDVFAVEMIEDWRTDYIIFRHIPDGESMLARILATFHKGTDSRVQ